MQQPSTSNDANTAEDDEEKEPIDPITLKPDLYAAAMRNDTSQVLQYLEQKVPPTFIDTSNNWTALHWAAMNGNVLMLKSLLENGASEPYHRLSQIEKINKQNRWNETAIDNGTRKFQRFTEDDDAPVDETKIEVIETSIEDQEAKEQERLLEISAELLKNTPLLWATHKGHIRVMWLLLSDGYSPNDIDNINNTAVHLAAANGDFKALKILIDDGGLTSTVNLYKNLPIDLAKNKEVRDLLLHFSELNASLSDSEIEFKHQQNMKQFNKMVNNLTSVVSEAARSTTNNNSPRGFKNTTANNNNTRIISNLADAIVIGKDWSLDFEMINEAEKLLLKLEVLQELIVDIEALQSQLPVRTQTTYINYVYKLEKSLERAVISDVDRSYLQISIDLIKRCEIEYWLNVHIERLKNVECADDSNEHDMNRLRNVIEKIKNQNIENDDENNNNTNNYSVELITEATKFLSRLDAELGMSRALKNIPSIKLPIENAPEGYWAQEDIGKVLENEGFPLPPIETNEYIWVPAENLTIFIQSIETLKNSFNGADSYGANVTMILEAKERLLKAEKEIKVLETKDLNDKIAAIEAVKKQAKKLKKPKSKGKK